jgi:hypothetical protein
MNANSLIEWVNKHNAKSRTILGFWEYFNTWRKEDRSEYLDTFHGKLHDEFIQVLENQINLKLRFYMEEAIIAYTVDILYLNEPIGTYVMEFLLNGEIEDEYLDFINFKHEISQIRENLTIARKAIKEDVQLSAIANITGIDEALLKTIKEKYC